MTENVLRMLLDGIVVGTVEQLKGGKLRFTYDQTWRDDRQSYPLSLSLPLARTEHGHDAISAYLWGLLPDNERVLDRWAKQFHVSPANPLSLLSHVGEDCAGAVQCVREERIDDVLRTSQTRAEIEWIDEREIAERLRTLRVDHAAWRYEKDAGQFSLAGAQPKTALLLHRGRWGIPSGRSPTTHILKPPTGAFEGHAENEHICLELARALGLPAALSRVTRFEDEVAIVVERYDRYIPSAIRASRARTLDIRRLHQEDLCQAVGVRPHEKYQNEGGPSVERIVELLRSHSSDAQTDVRTFVDAITLNWLIAGTDAHAKNYSVLHAAGGRLRLAPLYDLASALPYPELDQRRLKLAMKLGGTYRVRDVAARHFVSQARALQLDPEAEIARAVDLAGQLEAAIPPVVARSKQGGLQGAFLDALAKLLSSRATTCREALLVTSKASFETT